MIVTSALECSIEMVKGSMNLIRKYTLRQLGVLQQPDLHKMHKCAHTHTHTHTHTQRSRACTHIAHTHTHTHTQTALNSGRKRTDESSGDRPCGSLWNSGTDLLLLAPGTCSRPLPGGNRHIFEMESDRAVKLLDCNKRFKQSSRSSNTGSV